MSDMKKLGMVKCGERWSSVLKQMVPVERLRIKCDCERVLTLTSERTCSCGQRYNRAGQKLNSNAPRF